MTLADFDSKPREAALAICRRLAEAGHVAYFAGGCVRDELLGLHPSDYDVATDATPDRVRDIFGPRRTQAVGQAFGVMLVKEGRQQIEVATFRTDGDYSDGRRPDSVRFTNAAEDAQRRDFTINGLFRDPLAQAADPNDDGVIDHVGGKRDLADNLLRCIGRPRDRFGEDYLRMLRAVRFTARFDLEIHVETAKALIDLSPRLAAISPERVGEELRKMLLPPTRGRAWQLLWETRLIDVILRTIPGESTPGGHRPITREAAKIDRPIGVGLALAATAGDWFLQSGLAPAKLFSPQIADAAAKGLRRSLRLSNDQTQAVADALFAEPLLRPDPPSVATMKRFLARPGSRDARFLLHVAGTLDDDLQARVHWLESSFRQFDPARLAPDPLVTGDDLIQAGVAPGPSFKRALDAAYDAQLDGRATDQPAALAIAMASL